MNRKEKLLTEVLGHADGGNFALAAAARARRRHTVRRAGLSAGLAAALATAFFVARLPGPKPARAMVAEAPAFEILSDQELLAQLKDQPVLILKDRTGITGVVFLPDKVESKL